MPQLNQKGVVAQLLVVLLLIAGLGVGVYLVQTRTNLFPKAAVSRPIGPETSFTLIGPNNCASGWACTLQFQSDPKPGDKFDVKVYVRSDIEGANLFVAKIAFPNNLIEVEGIRTNDSVIKNWVENRYDNNTGAISLVGGVPSPGYKTKIGGPSGLMAIISFKAKTAGNGPVSFTDLSAIYSNSSNRNILTVKRNFEVTVVPSPFPTSPGFCGDPPPPPPGCHWEGSNVPPKCEIKLVCQSPSPTLKPTPSPSSSARPTPSPISGSGDANRDGKVDLIDLSILLTDFHKSSGFRNGIDMNGDGAINSFDVSLLRNLLIQKGVIQSR